MTEYADVPPRVIEGLRAVCLALPDTHEQQAWAGARWMVRRRTYAHVLTVDSAAGPVTILTFRAVDPELDVLRRSGHPFFRPGWGANTVGMVLDDATDWREVGELLTESYCVMAPRKLIALVARPG